MPIKSTAWRRTLWLAGLTLILAGAPLCAQQSIFGGPAAPAPGPESAESPPPVAEPAAEEEVVEVTPADWPLRRRLSQMMLATMQGSKGPSVDDLALLKAYTPGGVVIRHVYNPANAAVYASRVRGVEAITGIPLLVGTDLYELTQPGRTALTGFAQMPSMLSVAAANDPETTGMLAQLIAEHLTVLGFNLDLGPVLELAPVLSGARGSIYSLGSDAEFAAEAGEAICTALLERNVLPMPMGFPGGGANRAPRSRSSDKRTPAVLLTPAPAVFETDLLPYQRAIASGAPMIHVGNTLCPTLDPASVPASLSRIVVSDILRGKLGFKGVIAAGPLDSEDIASMCDPADAAIGAILAGADMLYFRGTDNLVMRVVDRLAGAVVDGLLTEERINASVARILAVKTNPEIFAPNDTSDIQAEKLGKDKDITNATLGVERKAITLVRNNGGILPLSKETSMPIGITGVTGVDELQEYLEKELKRVPAQCINSAHHLGEIQDFEIERIVGHIRGLRTMVCIFTDALRPYGQLELVRQIKAREIRVVAVLLGYPRYLEEIAEAGADAILLAYCDEAAHAETIAAMAEILMGEGPIALRTPPSVSGIKAGETRRFDIRELVRVPTGRLPVTLSSQFPAGLALGYDPTAAVKKAEWDFGDGKREKKPAVEHSFAQPGEYTVTLNVTGEQGDTDQCSFTVQVVE